MASRRRGNGEYTLIKHERDGESPRRLSFYRFNRVAFAVIPPLLLIATAYFLGLRPPKYAQVIYEEKKVQAPIEQVLGYGKEHFSNLEIIAKDGTASVYYPATAVKKYDGIVYSERSRQTEEFYSARSISDLTLVLNLPQEPVKILVAGNDYSSIITKTPTGYKATINPKHDLLSHLKFEKMDGKNGSYTFAMLEILVYYKNDESQLAEKSKTNRHFEDAERYIIRLIQNG